MENHQDTQNDIVSDAAFSPGDTFPRLHQSLPVFGVSFSGCYAIYIPGQVYIVSKEQFDFLTHAWSNRKPFGQARWVELKESMEKTAQKVHSQWIGQRLLPFTPERLTLYLSNQCKGKCIYCYAALSKHRCLIDFPDQKMEISLESVDGAARLVADACVKNNKPFRVAIHGGGEPTLHWKMLENIVRHTRELADERGLAWKGHLATNGIVSEARANWIADHFSSVSISHDGPPDIHNMQRPMLDGRPTLHLVERTLKTLQKKSVPLYVRTTLMPCNVTRQQEIIEYLFHQCQVTSEHLEPLYRVHGQGIPGFQPDKAELFVEHFLQAQTWAEHHGVTVSFSGIRYQELHGPYCNVLRNTLHLIPGNVATACFFTPDQDAAMRAKAIIGHWDQSITTFVLDKKKIENHRHAAHQMPESCRNCPISYQCARGCPTRCHVLSDGQDITSQFRCKASRLLAQHQICRVITEADAGLTPHNTYGITVIRCNDQRKPSL